MPMAQLDAHYKYDVFISYASEDRSPFVHSLVGRLRTRGLRVWYDQLELQVGQSLRQAIDKGIGSSKSAIVILSEHFFGKLWTNRELDGLFTQEDAAKCEIFPVWHGVGSKDVGNFSPMLAGRVALKSDKGAISVADRIRELTAPELALCSDPLAGKTQVLVVEDFGLVFMYSGLPTTPGQSTRVFEFSGREVDYDFFATALTGESEVSARMFEFEEGTIVFRTNQRLCDEQDIERGVVLEITEGDDRIACVPVCTSRDFTLAVGGPAVFERAR